MNYRKFYKEFYGIEFTNNFVIHHINGDRYNNDISNLILLPRKLHTQYHRCLNFLKVPKIGSTITDLHLDLNNYSKLKGLSTLLKTWINVSLEMSQWEIIKETKYNNENGSNLRKVKRGK